MPPVSALVAALVLGKRAGYPSRAHTPHNLTMTVLGAGLLWFGWFGFNAGGAVTGSAEGAAGAPGLAALALVNTHLAAAAGALVWALLEAGRQKATTLGVASGLVAGLVGITPAAGFVGPGAAMVIGALTGGACYAGVLLKHRFGYDDSLDAFGVHGVGGAAGAILTGVFATAALTPASVGGGALAGNLGLLGEQLLGLAAAGAYAAVVTVVLLKVIDKTVGLRVDAELEYEGLDGALMVGDLSLVDAPRPVGAPADSCAFPDEVPPGIYEGDSRAGGEFPRRGTIYLNFVGGTLQSGSENSAENLSTIARSGHPYPPFGGGELEHFQHLLEHDVDAEVAACVG